MRMICLFLASSTAAQPPVGGLGNLSTGAAGSTGPPGGYIVNACTGDGSNRPTLNHPFRETERKQQQQQYQQLSSLAATTTVYFILLTVVVVVVAVVM